MVPTVKKTIFGLPCIKVEAPGEITLLPVSIIHLLTYTDVRAV